MARPGPLPITPTNERLAEHLRRVLEAERRFGDDSARGFDDRGGVRVRLGEPVSVRQARSRNQVLSRSLMMAGPPDNQVWDYGPSGGVVLFAESGRTWRQASPLDLLPPELRSPKVGARQQQWSVLSTLFLHDVMLDLAPAERGYGRLFDDLDVVLNGPGGISEAALEKGLTPLAMGEAITQRLDGGEFGVEAISPAFFDEVATEQRRIEQARPAVLDATVPPVAALPLAVRAARFRSPAGGMRLEVAWAPEPGAFVGLEGAHVVRSAAVLTETGGPDRVPPRAERAARLTAASRAAGATIPVQAATLDALGRDPTVAVQVDVLEGEGAVVRRAVRRLGPLRALEAEASGLLVSDPLPHLVPEGAAAALSGATRGEAEAARARWRYPYAVVVPGARLGVYVEAYDLGTEGGASRYEVVRTVEVERGGERRFVSSSATESGTSSSTAREFIVLPVPADLEADDRVVLEGEIRDLVTGRAGTWSLSFGVVTP